jgi:hypothetical protein
LKYETWGCFGAWMLVLGIFISVHSNWLGPAGVVT